MGYEYNYIVLRRYFFMQKIIGFNRGVPWPVDFRSKVIGHQFIKKGIMCDPGDNIGVYINAFGGLSLGNNVNIGQNTTITTTNHDVYDHRKIGSKTGIEIGNNVTISKGVIIETGGLANSLERKHIAKPIIIGDYAWLGNNVIVLGGVNIGDGAFIGSGSIIRKDVNPYSIVIDNKIIGTRLGFNN